MRRSSADLVGLTESLEIRHHFQSYFLLMQPSALAHPGMRAFWDGVRILDDKLAVVKEYETGLKQFAEERGMTTEAMFPLARNGLSPRRNPTMHDWRDLVERGFPFVKVSLLRDNPLLIDLRGWRDLLASHGARLDAIDLHLGGVNPKAPGLIMR
jgi:lipopolysaccharide biosynthesis protein